MSKINPTPVSANGANGVLLRVGYDTFVFRVYGADTFIDYDLKHSDICMTITDEDAFFYHEYNEHYLDHAAETLGNE